MKKARLQICLGLSFLICVFISPFHSFADCQNNTLVRPNVTRLGKNRDLHAYRDFLGKPFDERLSKMSADQHLIDIEGADMAAIQISQGDENPGPNVSLVNHLLGAEERNHPGFHLLRGRELEEIPMGEFLTFHHADWVLDIFGTSFAKSNLNARFSRIHRLMAKGGEAWFVPELNSEVVLKSGKREPLLDYFRKHVRGFSYSVVDGAQASIVVLKRNDDAFFLPQLEYVAWVQKRTEIVRVYQEK